jgi:hypothetical protein
LDPGVAFLGGLGVFMYKRHKAHQDFNETYSPYDDDQDMSQYGGPVTQRPMGGASTTQHESSDGGSYGQYHGSPPPLGNVVQQPGGGGGHFSGGASQNPGAYAQYPQGQSPLGNAVQHLPSGDMGQNYGNAVQHLPGGDVGQNYGNAVQHLPGGDLGQGYGGGQYGTQYPFLVPGGDYRHSLSTGSQENDTHYMDTTARDSRGDSQNWGYSHYRSPSDASFERGHVPDEAPAPPPTATFDKPDQRD